MRRIGYGGSVLVSFCYLLLRRLLQLAALRVPSNDFKELEIVVLRNELVIFRRAGKRPALTAVDRLFLAATSRFDTQARGHIGRRLLHQRPDGELIEDPVWRWSSAPDRYFDTALRPELTSSPVLRLVDVASAPTVAATLLVWHLETG